MGLGSAAIGRSVGALVFLALVACGPPAASRPAAAPMAPVAPSAGAERSAPTADAASGDAALQALVAAARQEGALTLVWSQTTMGGRETVERWAEGFNRHYGLNLPVQFTPGPSMPEVVARIAQERQAGRRAMSDIVLGTEGHVASAMETDLLEPVDWAAWAPNVQDPSLVAPGGVAVQMLSTTPNITYNTNTIRGDLVPTSLADLLKPQYKGRIASSPYAGVFEQVASPEIWGEPRTMEYVGKLADQVSGLMRSGELDRIINGEFDVFAINSNEYDPRKRQAQGQPIAYAIPADAPTILYRWMGVPRNAEHPAAAKLWINYLLSREAQDTVYEIAYTDHYRLPGSKSAGEIQRLQASGVKFHDIDVGFVQRNDAKAQQRIDAELQRLLQKK